MNLLQKNRNELSIFTQKRSDGNFISGKATSYAGVNNAIYVEDIDKSIEALIKNGGTMISEKTELSGMGTIAYFKDTEENVFCLFQGSEKMT